MGHSHQGQVPVINAVDFIAVKIEAVHVLVDLFISRT